MGAREVAKNREVVNTMTVDDLIALADIHGGDPGRWPAAERPAAEALVAESPQAAAALQASRHLDAQLDAWRTPAPSSGLRSAILASAPRPREVRRRALLWLSGAGLATATAGMACGAFIGSLTVAQARDEGVVSAAFLDLGGSAGSSVETRSDL